MVEREHAREEGSQAPLVQQQQQQQQQHWGFTGATSAATMSVHGPQLQHPLLFASSLYTHLPMYDAAGGKDQFSAAFGAGQSPATAAMRVPIPTSGPLSMSPVTVPNMGALRLSTTPTQTTPLQRLSFSSHGTGADRMSFSSPMSHPALSPPLAGQQQVSAAALFGTRPISSTPGPHFGFTNNTGSSGTGLMRPASADAIGSPVTPASAPASLVRNTRRSSTNSIVTKRNATDSNNASVSSQQRAASSSPPTSRAGMGQAGRGRGQSASAIQRRRSEPANPSMAQKMSASPNRRSSGVRSRDRPVIGRRRRVSDLTRDFYCPQAKCNRRYEAWRSLQHHLRADHNLGMKLREYKNIRAVSGQDMDLSMSSRGSVDINDLDDGSPLADDLLDMEEVLYDVANAWQSSPSGGLASISPQFFNPVDPLGMSFDDDYHHLRSVLAQATATSPYTTVTAGTSGVTTATHSETTTPEARASISMSALGSSYPGLAGGARPMPCIYETGGPAADDLAPRPLFMSTARTPQQQQQQGQGQGQPQQRGQDAVGEYLRKLSASSSATAPMDTAGAVAKSEPSPSMATARRLSHQASSDGGSLIDDPLWDFLSVSFPQGTEMDTLSGSLPNFKSSSML